MTRLLLTALTFVLVMTAVIAANRSIARNPPGRSAIPPQTPLRLAVQGELPHWQPKTARASHSLSRPLFSATRRPWRRPAQDVGTTNVSKPTPLAKAEPVQRAEPPEGQLQGISENADGKMALLLAPNDKPQWVVLGQRWEGWVLREVRSASVVLERQGEAFEIGLYDVD